MLLSLLSWCSLRIRVRLFCMLPNDDRSSRLDIERMYGKRQPIAVRKPVASSCRKRNCPPPATSDQDSADGFLTPPTTEGETASETELETEVETDVPTPKASKGHTPSLSSDSFKGIAVQQQQLVSQHDLYHKYFRRDVVGLHNIDLLR